MRIPLLLYIAKNHWQKTLSNARENTLTTPDELPSPGISASPNRKVIDSRPRIVLLAAASNATVGREQRYLRPRIDNLSRFSGRLNGECMYLQSCSKASECGQMIIYRRLTVHQQWQKLVSLLSQSHNLLVVFDYCVKNWAELFF